MNLNFASDNTGPIAPQIMEAMVRANVGGAMPYGPEAEMAAVRDQFRALLGWPEAEVLLVATGTAANALALASMVRPWETVFCHRVAHIEEDECGAPEFYTGGAKLTLVEGADGKMTPDTLGAAVAAVGNGGVHGVQRGAVSITNVTETGAVYTLAEMAALIQIAQAAGLPVHLDGARFANACAALGCRAAELVAGVDVVSFGGTKNGCMGVEALVLRDGAGKWPAELMRKRAGHLPSKHRFMSAQMRAYLEGDLWLTLASRANAAAARLLAGLATVAEVVHPAQANMIFAKMPRAVHQRALAAGAQYYVMEGDVAQGPGEQMLLCRLVCDWSKTDDEVDALIDLFQRPR